jgi:[ribosomal protein S5]-alanine N-acetyltransferase
MPDPNIVLPRGAVTLRRLVEHDAANIVDNISDERVLRWLRNRVPNPYTLEHAQVFIRDIAPQRETFAVLHAGHLVGVIGADPQQDVYAHNMEVGYWFGVSHWGKGLASTAIAMLVEHIANACPNVLRLEACVFEGNEASARVLEKNGFVREAVRRQRVAKLGKLLDEWCYVRLTRSAA